MELTVRTVEEYRNLTEQARNGLETARQALVVIHQEQGWRLMGYRSFGDYIVNEFPKYSRQYLYRQVNAGLLESGVSPIGESLIGQHPESHLRAISETLNEPELQHYAYWTAQEEGANTARDYRRIAMSTAVAHGNNQTLRNRLEAGDVSVAAAYQILRMVPEDFEYPLAVYSSCNDPALVSLLMQIEGSDTWKEIINTLCVPSFDEPIPITEAAAESLKAWLNVSSAEHRARWIEENKERIQDRSARIRTLVRYVIELLPANVQAQPQIDELLTLIGEKTNDH